MTLQRPGNLNFKSRISILTVLSGRTKTPRGLLKVKYRDGLRMESSPESHALKRSERVSFRTGAISIIYSAVQRMVGL